MAEGRKEERKEPIRRTITVRARGISDLAFRRPPPLLTTPSLRHSHPRAARMALEKNRWHFRSTAEPNRYSFRLSLCDVTTVTDRALVIFIPRFKHRRFSGTAAADFILSCGFLAFRSDFCAGGRAGALLSLRRSRRGRKDRIDRVVSADFRRDCY